MSAASGPSQWSRLLKVACSLINQVNSEQTIIDQQPLTSSPGCPTVFEGETVVPETIPEIITKKVYHRGAMLIPRDIFDIAAASLHHADAVITELRNYREEVARTLSALDGSNPGFVNATIAQLSIRDAFRPVAKTGYDRARELLRAV